MHQEPLQHLRRLLPQVRDLDQVHQDVVAVEPQQRVAVEQQRADRADEHHAQADWLSSVVRSLNHQMKVAIEASTISTYIPAAPMNARCHLLGSIQESDTLQ